MAEFDRKIDASMEHSARGNVRGRQHLRVLKRTAGLCTVVLCAVAASAASAAPVTPPSTDPPAAAADRLAALRAQEAIDGGHDTITYDGKVVRVIPRETILQGAAKVPDLKVDSAGTAILGAGGSTKAGTNHRVTLSDAQSAKDLANAQALLKLQKDHPDAAATEKLLADAATHLPRDVLGPDNRYRVTPTTYYSPNAFVSLEAQPWGDPHCSGVVYGTSWIVTAGHCVLDEAGWHWPLWISRGRDGSSFPYGTCQGTYVAFDTWNVGGSTGTDYAAIKMACGVPGTYGNGIEPLVAVAGSNFSFTGWATGYPACCDPMPPGSSAGQQWEAYGYIISNTATSWQYSDSLDITTGQSGGPATRLCSAWGWGECVVGVNSRTQYRWFGTWNEAKRWVPANIASLAYWRDNL